MSGFHTDKIIQRDNHLFSDNRTQSLESLATWSATPIMLQNCGRVELAARSFLTPGSMPRDRSSVANDTGRDSSIPQHRQTTMSRIIVVDDDHGTTSLVKMLLEMEGYSVATFHDVKSVLDEARSGVSAFIIDCYLGQEATGIDLLRSLRRHESMTVKEAPVIMVSGDSRVEPEVKAAGADSFMLKPYSPNDLSREVKELIDGRAGRRQKQE